MLLDLGAGVELPDLQAAQRYRAATAEQTSRGRLHEVATWLAGVQGTDEPHAPARVRLIRIGGDDDTDVDAAVRRGVELADDEVDRGTDLLVLAVAHRDVAAEAIVAAVTNTEPVQVLPRGTVLPPDEWMRRAARIRDLRRALSAVRDCADELLAVAGDTALATATGLLLRATGRRTAVVLDGLAATTAGVIAYQVQGRTSAWWQVADASDNPAHAAALELLGQQPLLALGTSTDDGTAGLLAAELIRLAAGSARPDGM